MSNLLSFEPITYDVGVTPGSFIADMKSRLTLQGWQLVDENTGTNPYIIVKPPSGQTIGNTRGQGVLCLRAGSTSGKIELHTGLLSMATDKDPQMLYIKSGVNMRTGSGVSPECSIKINGSTISGTLSATTDGSLTSLYNALVASANADAQLFSYAYITNAGVSPTADDAIVLTAKSNATVATFSMPTPAKSGTSEGFTFVACAEPCPSGTLAHRSWSLAASLTADYTYGFICWLSILERTIKIAIKTNAAVQGPIFGSWAANALALANTPPGCTPIELVGGDLSGAATYGGGVCLTSHVYMKTAGYRAYYGPDIAYAFNRTQDPSSSLALAADVWSGSTRGTVWLDATARFEAGGVPHNISITGDLSLVGIGGLSPNSNLYGYACLQSPAIASVGLIPYQRVSGLSSNYGSATIYWVDEYGQQALAVNPFTLIPGLPLPDVTAFMASFSNETLHVARHATITTTLVTVMDATSTYGSIVLTDASAFPGSGTMLIGSEIFTWTGKSSNTLTGCIRGLYGSAKAAHAASDLVNLGTWFLKINGGAMPCGLVKPV